MNMLPILIFTISLIFSTSLIINKDELQQRKVLPARIEEKH